MELQLDWPKKWYRLIVESTNQWSHQSTANMEEIVIFCMWSLTKISSSKSNTTNLVGQQPPSNNAFFMRHLCVPLLMSVRPAPLLSLTWPLSRGQTLLFISLQLYCTTALLINESSYRVYIWCVRGHFMQCSSSWASWKWNLWVLLLILSCLVWMKCDGFYAENWFQLHVAARGGLDEMFHLSNNRIEERYANYSVEKAR